jgi:predicted secreted hydrolase
MRRLLLLIVVALFLAAMAALVLRGRWTAQTPQKREYTSVNRVLGGAPAAGFARADRPRRFRFPEDHGPHHDFRNEWWYFTGNLQSPEGRSFGYQLTFFRVALTPHPVRRLSRWGASEVYMAHFAVTDIDGKRFHYQERFSRAALGLAGAGGDPLAIRVEDWSAVEITPQPWGMKLSAADSEMAIEFDLVAVKPEVLNGEGGLSRKSGTPGNASYYYSIPRMKTTGTLRSGGKTFSVSGLSWLDREWSTSALERDQVGWDWFALQLQDGRDIMFYRIRRADGSSDPYSAGTLIAADGSSTGLRSSDVTLEFSRWWKSAATGVKYPSRWRMRIPAQGIDLEVVPRLPDQELRTGFRYWEGAVQLQDTAGKKVGSGYLEMTGY